VKITKFFANSKINKYDKISDESLMMLCGDWLISTPD